MVPSIYDSKLNSNHRPVPLLSIDLRILRNLTLNTIFNFKLQNNID